MTGIETMLLVGAITSAVGSVMQGVIGQQMANAEAEMYKQNAKIADMNAEIVSATAGRKEESQRRQARQEGGLMTVGLLEAGVGSGGTGAQLIAQNMAQLEMGALETRYSGMVEYTSLQNEATSLRYNAKAKRAEGKGLMMQGLIQGGASLIGGIASGANVTGYLGSGGTGVGGFLKTAVGKT
jgi:hypothetical protein